MFPAARSCTYSVAELLVVHRVAQIYTGYYILDINSMFMDQGLIPNNFAGSLRVRVKTVDTRRICT